MEMNNMEEFILDHILQAQNEKSCKTITRKKNVTC
jgi:hypothetical protein